LLFDESLLGHSHKRKPSCGECYHFAVSLLPMLVKLEMCLATVSNCAQALDPIALVSRLPFPLIFVSAKPINRSIDFRIMTNLARYFYLDVLWEVLPHF
jgi:hypothetical protein